MRWKQHLFLNLFFFSFSNLLKYKTTNYEERIRGGGLKEKGNDDYITYT